MADRNRKYTQEDFTGFLKTLDNPPNPFQKAVLEDIAFGTENLVVSAVAGSGKTTMIEMVAKLVRHKESITGEKPSKMMTVAFNVTIAEELEDRLSKYGARALNSHKIGKRIIDAWAKKRGERVYVEAHGDGVKYADLCKDEIQSWVYKNMDEDLYKSVWNNKAIEFYTESGDTVNSWKLLYSSVIRLIDVAVLNMINPQDKESLYDIDRHHAFDWQGVKPRAVKALLEEFVPYIMEKGRKMWEKERIYSLSEMVTLPITEKMPSYGSFDLTLADEAQDLNIPQQGLVAMLSGQDGRLIFVGDPMQAINGFAGADATSFYRVAAMADAKFYDLDISYRCSEKIAALARAITPQFRARPNAPEGFVKQGVHFDSLYPILQENMGILCRTNAQVAETFFELARSKIADRDGDAPSLQVLGKDVSQRILSVLDKIKKARPKRDRKKPLDMNTLRSDIENYEKREIGKVKSYVKSPTIREIKITDIQDDVETILLCLNHIQAKTESEFRSEIQRVFAGDELERRQNRGSKVTICTIHKSKGLEWDVVAIIAPDELPSYREGMREWQKQQERNLLYVAITRAKNGLYGVSSKPEIAGQAPKHAGFFSIQEKDLDEENADKVKQERLERALTELLESSFNSSVPPETVYRVDNYRETLMEYVRKQAPDVIDKAELVEEDRKDTSDEDQGRKASEWARDLPNSTIAACLKTGKHVRDNGMKPPVELSMTNITGKAIFNNTFKPFGNAEWKDEAGGLIDSLEEKTVIFTDQEQTGQLTRALLEAGGLPRNVTFFSISERYNEWAGTDATFAEIVKREGLAPTGDGNLEMLTAGETVSLIRAVLCAMRTGEKLDSADIPDAPEEEDELDRLRTATALLAEDNGDDPKEQVGTTAEELPEEDTEDEMITEGFRGWIWDALKEEAVFLPYPGKHRPDETFYRSRTECEKANGVFPDVATQYNGLHEEVIRFEKQAVKETHSIEETVAILITEYLRRDPKRLERVFRHASEITGERIGAANSNGHKEGVTLRDILQSLPEDILDKKFS